MTDTMTRQQIEQSNAKLDGMFDDNMLLKFIRDQIAKGRVIGMEKWLMLRHGLTYGDARAVIRYAKSDTAKEQTPTGTARPLKTE